MAKTKHGQLKDIKVKEVSMVDLPANKLPFLFFKREGVGQMQRTKAKKKIKIEIESNGLVGGTKVAVNGDDLGKLRSFDFSFYGDDPKQTIHASYSKVSESVDGFSRTETYFLTKGILMTKEMLEALQKYLGTDEIDFEKKVDEETVQEALILITEHYQESFPADLEKAVGIIAKRAASSYDVKEDVNKVGAKFSSATAKKMQAIIAAVEALKAIMGGSKESTQKAAVNESEEMAELTKQLVGLKEVIAKLDPEKKEKEDDIQTGIAELTKTLKDVSKRLETMEKATGTRKSLVDQDDDDDDDNKAKGAGEDGKVLWKSLQNRE